MTLLYHGTCIAEAADALLAGEGLAARRPIGRSTTPGSRRDLVYLTPAFGMAAEFSFNRDRGDWPSEHGLTVLRTHGWVFAFDMDTDGAVPDEDEVGFAAQAALAMEAFGEAPRSLMNFAFSARVKADADYRSMILDRLRSTPKAMKLIDGIDPRRLKATRLIKLGNALLDVMGPDDIEWTLAMGPSIGMTGTPPASYAHRLTGLIFDPSGLERTEIIRPGMAFA